jgi:hypothetical protein
VTTIWLRGARILVISMLLRPDAPLREVHRVGLSHGKLSVEVLQ